MVVVTNNLMANLINIGNLIIITIILTVFVIVIIKLIIEDIEFACEMRHKKKFRSEEKVKERNTQKQIDLLETENQKLINRISELEKENKDLKELTKW